MMYFLNPGLVASMGTKRGYIRQDVALGLSFIVMMHTEGPGGWVYRVNFYGIRGRVPKNWIIG